MKLRQVIKSVVSAGFILLSVGAFAQSNFNIVDEHHRALSETELEGHGPLMTALYALDYSFASKQNEKIEGEIIYFRNESATDSSPWSLKIQFKTNRSSNFKVITVVGHYESTGDSEGYGYGEQVVDGYWTVVKKQRKFVSLR